MNIFQRIKQKMMNYAEQEPNNNKTGYEEHDKTLISLRKHAKRYIDQDEKEKLRQYINKRGREQTKKMLFTNDYKTKRPTKPKNIMKQKDIFLQKKRR